MYHRITDPSYDFQAANTKQFTHCYHAYPAMMIPQIARVLIQNYAPQGKREVLFDPYMGSGTSLVEGAMLGYNCIGTDINPLARLITQAKTTHFDTQKIMNCLPEIRHLCEHFSTEKVKNQDFSRISNYTFWYSEEVLLKLSFISQIIDSYGTDIQLFFKTALSEVVREVSFTRNGEFKRFKMSEEQIQKFHPDVFGLFASKVERNLKGLMEFNATKNSVQTTICDFNTVYEIPNNILPKESVDMIVTSPPYGDSRTTVAYGQFSRWANEWFGFANAKNIDNILMGGIRQKGRKFITKTIDNELNAIKELDVKRYYEVISFLNDYHDSIRNVASVVRKGGRICYVVGNRTVKGIQIPLDFFTAEMFENYGFEHETTIVRNIPNKRMPSKTSPTNKAGAKVSTMSHEYIVIMTKKEHIGTNYKTIEPIQLSLFEPQGIYYASNKQLLIGACRQGIRQWIKDNLMYNYPITDEELSQHPELLKVANILVLYRKTVFGYYDVEEATVVSKEQLKELGYPTNNSRHRSNTKYILYKLKTSKKEIPCINREDFTQIMGKGIE